MINLTLYKHEMKNSLKLMLIFLAVITLYVTIIISMYDPEMMEMLDTFAKAMPELMAALGMNVTLASSLMEFMISYLYGFILLIFPMVFIFIRANALIAKYTDNGSMVSLLASNVSRAKIALTQLLSLITSIIIIIIYSTILEIITANILFDNELILSELLRVNLGLLCFHLCIASISFLASCIFSDSKLSLTFGAGIPMMMYVLKMLANVGGDAEVFKYTTIFTLFDASGLSSGNTDAYIMASILFIAAIVLNIIAVYIFKNKDLHI